MGARGEAAGYIRIAAGSVISAVASVLISKPDILARACQAMAARVDRTTSASGTFETSRNVTAVILRLHSVRRTGKIMTDDQLATDVNVVSPLTGKFSAGRGQIFRGVFRQVPVRIK